MAVVDNLKHTTELEMDLRLEAAAISEMAANIKGDEGFRVPERRLEANREARSNRRMDRWHSDIEC